MFLGHVIACYVVFIPFSVWSQFAAPGLFWKSSGAATVAAILAPLTFLLLMMQALVHAIEGSTALSPLFHVSGSGYALALGAILIYRRASEGADGLPDRHAAPNTITVTQNEGSSDQRPTVLDYAAPSPTNRRQKLSWYVAFFGCLFGAVAVLFIPATYGSGVIRQNPIAAGAAYLIWLTSVIYIWLRVYEEKPKSKFLASFTALCGTVAVIAAPLQFRALAGDPGYPQPRFRVALLGPGITGIAAVCGFVVGRVLARAFSERQQK